MGAFVEQDFRTAATPPMLAQNGADADAAPQLTVEFLSGRIRQALDTIGHKPQIVRRNGCNLWENQAALDRARENATATRDTLIFDAASKLLSDAQRWDKIAFDPNSPRYDYSRKARDNVVTFRDGGMTGQMWGDTLLRAPTLIDRSTDGLRHHLELNLTWNLDFEIKPQQWHRACQAEVNLYGRSPETLERHFQLAMVIEEILAVRSPNSSKGRDFKEDTVNKILTHARTLTNATENFLVRLAAAELCGSRVPDIGLDAARENVERAVVAALGHDPGQKIIPRRHYTATEHDAAKAGRLQQTIDAYLNVVGNDLRERWAAGNVPQEPILAASAAFLPDVPGPLPREDKPRLLEAMALSKTFKHYQLERAPS